jgi:hypothetical protein
MWLNLVVCLLAEIIPKNFCPTPANKKGPIEQALSPLGRIKVG